MCRARPPPGSLCSATTAPRTSAATRPTAPASERCLAAPRRRLSTWTTSLGAALWSLPPAPVVGPGVNVVRFIYCHVVAAAASPLYGLQAQMSPVIAAVIVSDRLLSVALGSLPSCWMACTPPDTSFAALWRPLPACLLGPECHMLLLLHDSFGCRCLTGCGCSELLLHCGHHSQHLC